MIGYRRIPIYLLFVLASLFAGCGSAAKSSGVMAENKVPCSVESTAQRLTLDLLKQGFEVSRGYFKLWTADQCAYTFGIMGMCYANNPAAPYVTFAVLPWPGEYVDAATSSLWGPSQEGYNDIFRFDPREAIVILGELPPRQLISPSRLTFSRGRGPITQEAAPMRGSRSTCQPCSVSFSHICLMTLLAFSPFRLLAIPSTMWSLKDSQMQPLDRPGILLLRRISSWTTRSVTRLPRSR